MGIFRSLYKMVFGKKEQQPFGQQLQLLNGYTPSWTDYDGRLYSDNEIRSCIDAIARNVAKLNPKHIREYDDKGEHKIDVIKGRVHRLISKRPNEVDNAYNFYYKVCSELMLNNNAFIYIRRDEFNRPDGLYVLKSGCYQLLEYDGHIFIRFNFTTGQQYTASLEEDIIHLKRFYCENEIKGGSNTPITKLMSIKHIINEGIVNAIKTTQSIKGVLKTTKAMLKPEDIKATRDQFVNDFTNSESGIAGLDATTDFKEINISPQTTTDSQLTYFDDQLLNYFGLNKKILQSSFSEDEWSSFYESVIEPIALQMGLEFTEKIFTASERFHGNEIYFESNRLQYASNTTKVNIARYMGNYLTINEIREIFNLAPVQDGDIRLQSLNYVSSDIADDYQMGDIEQ